MGNLGDRVCKIGGRDFGIFPRESERLCGQPTLTRATQKYQRFVSADTTINNQCYILSRRPTGPWTSLPRDETPPG